MPHLNIRSELAKRRLILWGIPTNSKSDGQYIACAFYAQGSLIPTRIEGLGNRHGPYGPAYVSKQLSHETSQWLCRFLGAPNNRNAKLMAPIAGRSVHRWLPEFTWAASKHRESRPLWFQGLD